METQRPNATLETALNLGLTEKEYDSIKENLGRLPNHFELQIFASLWSEEITKKSTASWLSALPDNSKRIVTTEKGKKYIDLGKEDAYYIQLSLDDISSYTDEKPNFSTTHSEEALRALDAQNISSLASFNWLQISNFKQGGHFRKFHQLIEKLATFSNVRGHTNASTEIFFHQKEKSPGLLAQFTVGYKPLEERVAQKELSIFLLGKIQGNEPLGETNPFVEKCLSQALQEAFNKKICSYASSVGTGGILLAAVQLAGQHGSGCVMHLDSFLGEKENWVNHLLKRTRARVLLAMNIEKSEQLKSLADKWHLEQILVGRLQPGGNLSIVDGEQELLSISTSMLEPGNETLGYQKDLKKPSYLKKLSHFNASKTSKPKDYQKAAEQIWMSANVISRQWIREQFDTTIGNNTLHINNPADAALIRLKGHNKSLALTVTGNPYYTIADPSTGTMIAVAEAARRLICSGASPLATSAGFYMGTPESPEAYWQFTSAVKGLSEACKKLKSPIIDKAILHQQREDNQAAYNSPLSIIGMLGLLEKPEELMTQHFKLEGHQIYMLGTPHNDFSCSEYLRTLHNVDFSPIPKFDLDEEFHTLQNLRNLIKKGWIQSAHTISNGGLFVSLLQSALCFNLGFNIETDGNFRKDAYLFGESQSRLVISVTKDDEDEVVNYLNSYNVSFSKLGEVSGDKILIDDENFGKVEDWKKLHDNWYSEKVEI